MDAKKKKSSFHRKLSREDKAKKYKTGFGNQAEGEIYTIRYKYVISFIIQSPLTSFESGHWHHHCCHPFSAFKASSRFYTLSYGCGKGAISYPPQLSLDATLISLHLFPWTTIKFDPIPNILNTRCPLILVILQSNNNNSSTYPYWNDLILNVK